MSMPGVGVTQPAETESAPPPSGGRGVGQVRGNRLILLIAGAVGIVVIGGLALVLLTRGGGEGGSAGAGGVTTAPTTRPSASPSATTSASATATTSAGSADTGTRNPFVPRATSSGSASASSTDTAGATVTATVADTSVWLSLFSVASDGKAVFAVNGTTYTQSPGDTFGDGSKLTYHKTTTVSGTKCAVVSYDGGSSFTVCPGDMHLAS